MEDNSGCPSIELKLLSPLWYIDIPAAGVDCLSKAWKTADRKMKEMLKFDFPDLPPDVLNKLDLDLSKKVLAHSIQSGSVYVYLLGTLQVEAGFDSCTHKQASWMPISKLAALVSDGRNPKGTVPISTRMIASVLRDFLFGELDVKITMTGAITVQSKEEALSHMHTIQEGRSRTHGMKGKMVDLASGQAIPLLSMTAGGVSEASTSKPPLGIASVAAGGSPGYQSLSGQSRGSRKFRGKQAEGRGRPHSQLSSKRMRLLRSPAKTLSETVSNRMEGGPKPHKTPEKATKKSKSQPIGGRQWVAVGNEPQNVIEGQVLTARSLTFQAEGVCHAEAAPQVMEGQTSGTNMCTQTSGYLVPMDVRRVAGV